MPINKETILSVYNDKLTLMQWLKTIENALKNDTLNNVELLQDGNQVAFKFVFENSELITNYIELQANGIKAINYDSTTLQLVFTFTDDTIKILGPLFDENSNVTVQDLNAVSITSEGVTTDALTVDGGAQVNDDLTVGGNLSLGESGEIRSLDKIVDKQYRNRFIEGEGISIEQEGINITYNKWSLSGTHLMFVCAGSITDTTVINANSFLTTYELPKWICDKIYPVFSQNIEVKNIVLYNPDWSSQQLQIKLQKHVSENKILFQTGALTLTKDRNFRVEFDLLIDTD